MNTDWASMTRIELQTIYLHRIPRLSIVGFLQEEMPIYTPLAAPSGAKELEMLGLYLRTIGLI